MHDRFRIFRDALDYLQNCEEHLSEEDDELTVEEIRARNKLIELCEKIAAVRDRIQRKEVI